MRVSWPGREQHGSHQHPERQQLAPAGAVRTGNEHARRISRTATGGASKDSNMGLAPQMPPAALSPARRSLTQQRVPKRDSLSIYQVLLTVSVLSAAPSFSEQFLSRNGLRAPFGCSWLDRAPETSCQKSVPLTLVSGANSGAVWFRRAARQLHQVARDRTV